MAHIKRGFMMIKYILSLGILMSLLVGCQSELVATPMVFGNEDPLVKALETRPIQHTQAIEKEERLSRVTLSAVGDVMVHKTQLVKADRGDRFDFEPAFQWVKPLIESADYAIANLETTFAGPSGQRRIRLDQHYKSYSGYPVFNTPDIMGDNLKDAGFDLLLTANNHTLDSKESGLIRTIEVIDDLGLDHIGTYLDAASANEPFIKEINGIKFGIINYTYAMNGFNLTAEDDYMIKHLNNYDDIYIQNMNDEVKAMSALDVDFVVVTLHYGIEYRTHPDPYVQQPMIDALFDHGADIILGGHPHVLQPFEVRQLIKEDGSEETGVVIYSLGNFVASQRFAYTGDDTDVGVIFELDFKKVDNQKAMIEAISICPTYLYFSEDAVEVIPVLDPPEQLVYSAYDLQRLKHAEEVVIPLLGEYTQIEPEKDGSFLRYLLKEVDE